MASTVGAAKAGPPPQPPINNPSASAAQDGGRPPVPPPPPRPAQYPAGAGLQPGSVGAGNPAAKQTELQELLISCMSNTQGNINVDDVRKLLAIPRVGTSADESASNQSYPNDISMKVKFNFDGAPDIIGFASHWQRCKEQVLENVRDQDAAFH